MKRDPGAGARVTEGGGALTEAGSPTRTVAVLRRKVAVLRRRVAVLRRRVAGRTWRVAVVFRSLAAPKRRRTAVNRRLTAARRMLAVVARMRSPSLLVVSAVLQSPVASTRTSTALRARRSARDAMRNETLRTLDPLARPSYGPGRRRAASERRPERDWDSMSHGIQPLAGPFQSRAGVRRWRVGRAWRRAEFSPARWRLG